MLTIFNWLARLADKTDPTASLKHVAFMAGIAFSCLWLTIALVVRTKVGDVLVFRGIDGNWVAAFGLFLTAITGAKIWSEKSGSTVTNTPGTATVLQPGETEVKS